MGAATPLGDLELVCGDIFDRWDRDMRSGKLLGALSGNLSPGYDPRVDRIRKALRSHADLHDALDRARSDAKLAADSLGNSDDRFRSVEEAFRIIERRTEAALAKARAEQSA